MIKAVSIIYISWQPDMLQSLSLPDSPQFHDSIIEITLVMQLFARPDEEGDDLLGTAALPNQPGHWCPLINEGYVLILV